MKIFLIEDDPVYQDIIASDLEDIGHKVTVHGCVNEAAEKIILGNFDLLVVDINLPETDDEPGNEVRDGGIQVLQQVVDESFPLPPTIFVSIYGYIENKEHIEALFSKVQINKKQKDGKPFYIQKPYDNAELIKTVKIISESIGG